MNVRRSGPTDESEGFGSQAQLPFTALALHPGHSDANKPKPHDENGGISVFWRVFGGTIISIVALVGITLYNSVNSQIAELRNTVAKMSEERAELVKKDEFGTRLTSNWDRIQSIQNQNNEQNAIIRGLRTELDGFKEKITRCGMDLDGARKDLLAVEGLKEKIGTLLADFKTSREEYTKIRQDVDKNISADQERKLARDEQYKAIDKSLKDLNTSLQDLQIKLARLEGATSAPVEKDKPKATPAGSTKDK